MKILGVAIAVTAVTLVGCGGKSAANQDVARAVAPGVLSLDELAIGSFLRATIRDGSGRAKLYDATLSYIGHLRKYRQALGDAAVRTKLTDAADELQGWCDECVAALDRERQNMG